MLKPCAKVIVNPAAGANSTYRKWPCINHLLRQIGLIFDFEYTHDVGHAIELARVATDDGYRYLVAVGGDGTINEVANGILRSTDSSSVALGIVNTGTGSDFIRSAGIPRHYAKACSILTSQHQLTIDVGVVKFSRNGQILQRYFVNTAGVGFDATVAKATEELPKFFGGTFPYLIGLVKTLFSYRNKLVVLDIGGVVESERILSVVVANGGYFGGGMHIAPEAKLDDNLLEVVVVGDVGKFELLRALPMVYKGTHANHPKVCMKRAECITVESPEQILVYADGELIGEDPASFWLLPSALNVMV